MIVTNYEKVRAVYERAAREGWVLPCFCSENQTTTEAVLAAAQERGRQLGRPVPVILAITVNYGHRSQAPNYACAKDWRTGLKLFRDDAEIFAGPGGPYEDVETLIHLDHVQFDLDAELLEGDLSPYSSVMYDASALPFAENMARTAEFVRRHKGKILIEGACDEIVDAGGAAGNELTTPDRAKEYAAKTGVDMMVANLGTEHRASGKDLHYHGELAREIRRAVGPMLVLHGASSVSEDQIADLFQDGICKVNIWTALERDSSPVLFEALVRQASKAAGPAAVDRLIAEGYLTEKCRTGEKQSLAVFTEFYRRSVVFEAMKKLTLSYLELWYR